MILKCRFRWAYCVLQELKMLKSTKPILLSEALHSLPASLDDYYERILTEIGGKYREDALRLLRWLAFAQSPLNLSELVDAATIDPMEGKVDLANRGDLDDVLHILSGLVVTAKVPQVGEDEYISRHYSGDLVERPGHQGSADHPHQSKKATVVRLAHFSVREYLESTRIVQGSAQEFHLRSGREHLCLARSCLAYLIHYSKSKGNLASAASEDLEAFPLLNYASQSWFHHSSLQQGGDFTYETNFLGNTGFVQHWVQAYQLVDRWSSLVRDSSDNFGSGVYYASLLGLYDVVRILIANGADVNFQGGNYGNPLQAASSKGYSNIAKVLINVGANVNAHGGAWCTALQAASSEGYEEVVQMLIIAGADVNAQGGGYGNAVRAASWARNEKVMQMLLDNRADVNAPGGDPGPKPRVTADALQVASYYCDEKMVQMLIDAGADVNAREGDYGCALESAALSGNMTILQMLIAAGVNVHTLLDDDTTNALDIASSEGDKEMVRMLVKAGANVNTPGLGEHGSALEAAFHGGHADVMQMLIDAGAGFSYQGERRNRKRRRSA